jgi:hypothetical protein
MFLHFLGPAPEDVDVLVVVDLDISRIFYRLLTFLQGYPDIISYYVYVYARSYSKQV